MKTAKSCCAHMFETCRNHWRRMLLLAALPVLVACENSATAFMVDGKDHALILVREQKTFWDDEIKQAIIVSRLPQCQKRVTIHPGRSPLADIRVYQAGDNLWALHQGQDWYLASTQVCQVQDWDNPNAQPPGAYVGRFTLGQGEPVFIAAEAEVR